MKEYTLQEAIVLCSKNGGRFYAKEYKESDKYWMVDKYGKIINIQSDQVFELAVLSFESKWIYEPPKQSAFQTWIKNTPTAFKNMPDQTKTESRLRKEGWNAAIDEVCNLCLPIVEQLQTSVRQKIRELKEE